MIGQQEIISHSKLQVKLCLDVFMHDDVVTLQILLHTLPDVVWGFMAVRRSSRQRRWVMCTILKLYLPFAICILLIG